MTTPLAQRVLVVDDERPILLTLEALLGRHGYQVETARTAAEGLKAAFRTENRPDLVLLDLGLPDASGLDVLTKIKKEAPKIHVIVLTAQDSLSNAIDSIKFGAFHFISKPYAPEELLSLMKRAFEQQALADEAAALREQTKELKALLRDAEARVAATHVSRSRRMVEIEDFVRRIAPSEANVLITGESGTGKEVVANLIHSKSQRARGPMVKLNCAALPQQMIEGELFGYVKGAFTGAVNDFPGMIASAHGGTLFLDEIAEMPASLQTRFLRVLQEREFRPLGSTRTLKADFRLVAATNQPIARAVREGVLRSDLYYRLNTFQIELPPLRDRCASSQSKSRLYANAAKTSRRSSIFSSDVSPRTPAARSRRASPRKRSRSCATTPGRATSASCKTPCNTPSSSLKTTSSRKNSSHAKSSSPSKRTSRCQTRIVLGRPPHRPATARTPPRRSPIAAAARTWKASTSKTASAKPSCARWRRRTETNCARPKFSASTGPRFTTSSSGWASRST